eukprot:scaffold8357_cov296-Pinguiococcus_pyrenoidosus.AAC.4
MRSTSLDGLPEQHPCLGDPLLGSARPGGAAEDQGFCQAVDSHHIRFWSRREEAADSAQLVLAELAGAPPRLPSMSSIAKKRHILAESPRAPRGEALLVIAENRDGREVLEEVVEAPVPGRWELLEGPHVAIGASAAQLPPANDARNRHPSAGAELAVLTQIMLAIQKPHQALQVGFLFDGHRLTADAISFHVVVFSLVLHSEGAPPRLARALSTGSPQLRKREDTRWRFEPSRCVEPRLRSRD